MEAHAQPPRSAANNNGYFGFRVSVFDDSAENHFIAMDAIAELCGDSVPMGRAPNGIDDSEIRRLSSSVTFLREWRLFNYEPRDFKFEGVNGVNLHQFSSATVPKNEELYGEASSPEPRDFVMYAGGPVWALDWCPRVCESPDSRSKCEFIAISAHPPGSSYHKLGAPLSGRGLVQIWCVLNVSEKAGDIPSVDKPKRGRKRSSTVKEKPEKVKKPRGRPRKNPVKDRVAELDGSGQYINQPLDIIVPENSSDMLRIEGIQQQNINEQNCRNKGESACNAELEVTLQRNNIGKGNESKDTNQPLLTQNEHTRSLSSQRVKRPMGRPRKKPLKELVAGSGGSQQLDTQVAENSSTMLSIEGVRRCTQQNFAQENDIGKQNPHKQSESLCNMTHEATMQTNNVDEVGNNVNQLVLSQDQHDRSFLTEEELNGSGQDPGVSGSISNQGILEVSSTGCSLPNHVSLPRMVLCLAHNGKVAWDVKWRPCNAHNSNCKSRMGFLAILLGDGSLEV